jgi:hypothetical protein
MERVSAALAPWPLLLLLPAEPAPGAEELLKAVLKAGGGLCSMLPAEAEAEAEELPSPAAAAAAAGEGPMSRVSLPARSTMDSMASVVVGTAAVAAEPELLQLLLQQRSR